ncbi:YDR541C [Saccharomyces arboricola H-6]|uniref:YDR541C n=1 Tax=Saccharomyces arboricola (strain H-6 / AS 2.3317 / CBS 10644) TaxID=1160507 RepID=J8LN33_SACAR|nr:YDR541C [Saccharomyces arboricola H-6]
MSGTVLVSGASGFIALHIVSELLKQNYKVIGTVRSHEKKEKLRRQFQHNPNLFLEIVPDISQSDAFESVFKKHGREIRYVLHTSSPFYYDTTEYEKDLLIPALEGTKNMLNSIKRHAADTVERVVVTSSCTALITLAKASDPNVVFTEESWNEATWDNCQIDGVNAYFASKKFAEVAAWDFVKENAGHIKFKLTTVNPSLVFGPQLFDEDVREHLNTSCEIINDLIHTPVDATLADFHSICTDVRDVAKAHMYAFQKENTVGKRLVVTTAKFGNQDILDILNKDFPQLNGVIPLGKPGTGDQVTNSGATTDNSVTRKILGFEFKSLCETVHDTAAQILKKENRL